MVMKVMRLFLIFAFCILQAGIAQEDFLAKQYFNDGDFEKALVYYERLVSQQPRRPDFAEGLVACYQQLERYEEAENFLLARIDEGVAFPTIYVDLGYNHRLQGEDIEAEAAYEKALAHIDENPNFGYGIGFRFQKYTLLPYALTAYKKAMALNPRLNYRFQIAKIYGELGEIENMFDAYLGLLVDGNANRNGILRNMENFISAEPEADNNQILKKLLLRRAQKQPNVLWNELLSWLFVQQNQFYNAFTQEKAIYKRSDGRSTERLEQLGQLALDTDIYNDAKEIFEYVLKESTDPVVQLNAQLHLIDIDLLVDTNKNIKKVRDLFQELMSRYGYQAETMQLQIAYANFLTFKDDKPEEAIKVLKELLKLPLSRYGEAYAKLALGDILVFDQKFNQALIYFSQVQRKLKNDVLAQDARYKVAQTSFYKGDFEWALTQLKVLRGSTSQLIANDAMQLSLLISDNSLEDSTQTALKKFARADLLAYQNRNDEAINVLEDILQNHKGEKIEDEALLKQGQLLEAKGDYDAARLNYRKIVEFYASDILADDAHFYLAELYRKKLNAPEKAQGHYEKILYNYQDSYYFPQARKEFRRLRGDLVN